MREFEDIVVFETARFSLNELNELRESIFETFGKEYQIISHSVDERQNKVNLGFLELNDNFKASLSSELSELSTALTEMTGSRGETIDRALDMNLFILSEQPLMGYDEPEERQVGISPHLTTTARASNGRSEDLDRRSWQQYGFACNYRYGRHIYV